MSVVSPVFSYVGFMIKDVGARMVLISHKLSSRRLPCPVIRHQNIRLYRHIMPIYEDAAFIAPNAMVQGNVILGHNTALFYHTLVRNYHSKVATRIGDNSVVLDRTSFMGQVKVGHDSFIGVGCTLDMCDVHDNVYIGHGSAICVGAVIENNAILAPGTVIEKDTRVPAGQLWAGNPGRKIADVTPEQASEAAHQLHEYIDQGKKHALAIREHYAEGETLDKAWLAKMCERIEARNTQMMQVMPEMTPVPEAAKRFMTPRITQRLPAMHVRVSYPVNRIAPWMAKPPDWPSNS